MTIACARPAITAPDPRPSRTKRKMSFNIVLGLGMRSRESGSSAAGYGPSLGRSDEVAGEREDHVVVLVELRVVVAGRWCLRVLAALEHRRSEDQRAGEGLHLGEDR